MGFWVALGPFGAGWSSVRIHHCVSVIPELGLIEFLTSFGTLVRSTIGNSTVKG